MRIPMMIAALISVTACVAVPVSFGGGLPQARKLATVQPTDAAFHALLQDARTTPIVTSAELTRAARGHAADMVARSYFAHRSPEGVTASDRAAAQGVPACGIAENIAQGQGSAAAVFADWMASAGHRANMLNPNMASYGLGRAGDTWVLKLYQPC